MNDLNPIEVSNNVSLTLSYDELYQMSRLYETLLETDHEFHPLVDDVFINQLLLAMCWSNVKLVK